MRVLALIPARGASKGIPRKNVKLFGGKPLIAWTIEAAAFVQVIDSIVVTTDDEEIADVARAAGAEVPFLRPVELSRDDSSSLDVVIHALDNLPGFEAVLLLQPTSPLRTADDIKDCLALAAESGSDSVASVVESESHPYWMYYRGKDRRLRPVIDVPGVSRRQDLTEVYSLNGAMYFARCDWLRESRAFVTSDTLGYVMPRERSVDIDDEVDWALAEVLMKTRPEPF